MQLLLKLKGFKFDGFQAEINGPSAPSQAVLDFQEMGALMAAKYMTINASC